MRRLLLLTTGVLTCCLLGLLPVWAAPQGLLPPAQPQGPVTYVLATLPAGNYTINAWYRDQTLTSRVHVTTHKPVHVLFIWTASASSLTEGERAATP
jgi:hypothetical protein